MSILTQPVSPRIEGPAVRMAGLLYLVIIVCGLSAELALRGPLITADAAETVARISANLPVFRASLLADLAMLTADIVLALLFFQLLRTRSEPLARAAMVFRLMQAALIGTSLILLSAVPALVAQDDATLARLLITLHANGYDIGLVLFGANSLLMARLLYSGAMPRLLPAGIAAAGLVYVAGGLVRLATPDLTPMIEPAYAVPILAESALCLWLLIVGRL